MEEEAAYLFYREEKAGKEPGIKMFRIAPDGTYNVTYDDPSGIAEMEMTGHGENEKFFSIDGKQLTQPQRGLNIVRKSDGTVKKHIF